ncbi:MAG: superoxide dismutase family protein [Gammaproteobacteria bacterium]|nr:superoxide dismutase family protein [Gammaproteobacteria bacterium]MCP5459906.1 superoxide dismutase family protein [Gammaproteobacteria bacterium]
MTISIKHWLLALGLATAGTVHAEITVDMHSISAEGVGDSVGAVVLVDSPYGLLITPNLQGLTPGQHGFHVHTNPDCGAGEKDGKKVAGLAAGGHFDPANTGVHKGPYDSSGHLGDLPPLYVDSEGKAVTPMLAPRLKEEDIKGRSLMVHMHGDNFSDEPAPLGGGGARMICGVIPE